MLTCEQVAQIEAAQRAGYSIRAAARELGFDRNTIRIVFNGAHSIQLGRQPAESGVPLRRFLIAFAETIGPIGVKLQSSDEWARYRDMHERKQLPVTHEATDDIEPTETTCNHCGYPLMLEWVHGRKYVVANGRTVKHCPHCKKNVS